MLAEPIPGHTEAVRVFGLTPIHEGEELAEAPVGERCLWCSESIEAGDMGGWLASGEPYHQECTYRNVVGGIGHLENHTLWCTHRGDPDGGRTYRQSALEVWALRPLRGPIRFAGW